MKTTTEEIGLHIEQTRGALDANITELKQKVNSITDWERHFHNRPGTSLALAFGGGLLLAVFVGGRSKRSPSQQPLPGRTVPSKTGSTEAWDKIKGVILGVAVTRLTQYAEEYFPAPHKANLNSELKT